MALYSWVGISSHLSLYLTIHISLNIYLSSHNLPITFCLNLFIVYFSSKQKTFTEYNMVFVILLFHSSQFCQNFKKLPFFYCLTFWQRNTNLSQNLSNFDPFFYVPLYLMPINYKHSNVLTHIKILRCKEPTIIL